MNVAVIGTGYVGLIQSVCLAHLGHQVIGFEIDAEKVARLNRGEAILFEQDLPELLQKGLSEKRLRFTNDSIELTAFKPEIIFICVGTPSTENGGCDLRFVKEALAMIEAHFDASVLIVLKSTIPPGTTAELRASMKNPAWRFAANPEFLQQGTSIKNFLHPHRVVIGVENEEAEHLLREVYKDIDAPIVVSDVNTAQLIKYASNAMLALRLSFMNEMAVIADLLNADIKKVEEGVGLDPRIGKAFLRTGAGFGGSCFPKDVLALYETGKHAGYESKLIEPIIRVNEEQTKRFVQKARERLHGFQSKTLAIWGLTYNKGTDDLRDSPAMTICEELLSEGAILQVFDPQGMQNAMTHFGDRVNYASSAHEALKNAECLFVLTEWPEFLEEDFRIVAHELKQKLVFDGKHALQAEKLAQAGMEVIGIGLKKNTG